MNRKDVGASDKEREYLVQAITEGIAPYINEHKIKQESLEDVLGIKRSTINKLLRDGIGVSLYRILILSKSLGISLDQVFKPVMETIDISNASHSLTKETSQLDEDHKRKSGEHLQRIIRFEKSTYLAFFLHNNNDGTRKVDHMFVDTFHEVNSSAIPVSLRIFGRAEHSYHGHVVSPPGQPYVYLYMRQDIEDYDRGVMVFHYFSGDIEGQVQGTAGVMLSTERNTKTFTTQWVVLLRIKNNEDAWPHDLLKDSNDPNDLRKRSQAAKIVNDTDAELIANNPLEAKNNWDSIQFQKWITDLDSIIEPFLSNEIPDQNDAILQFELEERHKSFKKVYYPEMIKVLKAERISGKTDK